MSKVSTYLNFVSETEEAFNFYKVVFKTDFEGGIMRFGDIPASPDMPAMPESVKSLVMHCMMPIMDGHYLMGSDAPVEMGFQVHKGNNSYIMLQPDTREETKQLFDALAVGGVVEQELQDMFWGDYYGSLKDKFGVQWMFNCSAKQ
ncbi:MAG: VOC family protein [Paludibacter sp.]